MDIRKKGKKGPDLQHPSTNRAVTVMTELRAWVCAKISENGKIPRKWLNPSRENDDKPLGFGRKKTCELPGRILVRSCEFVSGNPCAELPKRILVCITCVSFTCFPLNLQTNSCQDGAQAVNGMIFFGNYNHFVAIYSLYRNRGCNLQTMVPLPEPWPQVQGPSERQKQLLEYQSLLDPSKLKGLVQWVCGWWPAPELAWVPEGEDPSKQRHP